MDTGEDRHFSKPFYSMLFEMHVKNQTNTYQLDTTDIERQLWWFV